MNRLLAARLISITLVAGLASGCGGGSGGGGPGPTDGSPVDVPAAGQVDAAPLWFHATFSNINSSADVSQFDADHIVPSGTSAGVVYHVVASMGDTSIGRVSRGFHLLMATPPQAGQSYPLGPTGTAGLAYGTGVYPWPNYCSAATGGTLVVTSASGNGLAFTITGATMGDGYTLGQERGCSGQGTFTVDAMGTLPP